VKAGKAYYLYIDPDACKCVFLSDEGAMQGYRDLATSRRLQQPDNVPPGGVNPERLIVEEDNIDGGDIPDGDIWISSPDFDALQRMCRSVRLSLRPRSRAF
jgi:hypothetical protein